jgi:hypothetical protein
LVNRDDLCDLSVSHVALYRWMCFVAHHSQDANSEANDQPANDEHCGVDCASLERGTDHTAGSSNHHGFLPTPGVIHGGADTSTHRGTGLQHGHDTSYQGRAWVFEICEEEFLSDGIGDDT